MLRLSVVRYAGLTATCLLALAGWLGGALPGADLAATPPGVGRGPYGPVILGCWLAGTVVQAWAWWTLRDRVPSPRWAVVTTLWWVLPGPLFVLIATAAVVLGGSLAGVLLLLRLLAVAGLVAVAAGLPVLARRCGVPEGRALWVALAGPLVGPHLVGGPHNDALLIGLLVAALAVLVAGAHRPGVQVAAGALLGAAVAIKVTAVVVLPFAVLVAVRRPYRTGTATPATSSSSRRRRPRWG